MVRILATVAGLGALAVGLVAFGARWLPISGHPSLIVAAASPYLAVAAPVAMLLLVLGRRWMLTLVAVALTVALMWVYVPRYLGSSDADVAAVDLRVLTANLGMGQADPAAFVALAGAAADVVAVQEMTQEAADGLAAAGMDTAFPHRVIVPAPMASGIGIWSRHPIVHSGRIDGYALPMVGSRIRIPGVRVDTTVLSVHLAAPWPMPIAAWQSDLALFPDTLREVGRSAGAGAVIVAGDFNATADMAPFNRLLDQGYGDAGPEAGAGLARTYPGRGMRPPLLGIDHILTKNCSAATAETVVVPGADHRGLLATLRVPVDMTAS
ncbi:endonuclease/exonuclease/phosphatase family protein [Mycolicibacterium austroafricanum]|uniref:endonuclease/exonuclease/phosphatase family protein n=1 Tax=Mycolicibacterium austroafricanum TaxID=39687 RepID=UPI00055ABBC5|nr:endonuclease/exonuclease/phosphatase family protein [Mycolicibacterium austroafricanum]QZY46813.1 endonuclease/exonuclease/phosphatase family protein [Mycolicibacterium austroafricanum]